MFGRCCCSVHGYYFHNSWQECSAETLSPAPAFREEEEAEVSGHYDLMAVAKLELGVHTIVCILANEIHGQPNTLTRRAPGHTYCRTLFHRRRCLGGGGFRREWFVMQELLRYSG